MSGPRGLLDSFNYAFEGIIHVLRTQRNMRIHVAVAVVVLVVAVDRRRHEARAGRAPDLDRLRPRSPRCSTARIEGAIDVATSSFDPMAKLAKDTAAGAVLIAAINAVAVGYLVFSGKTATRAARLVDRVREVPAELTIVALVLTVIAVIWLKAWTGSGTPLRGGLPSGHAAVAFAGWVAATYASGPEPPLPRLDDHLHPRAARRPDAAGIGRSTPRSRSCSAGCSGRSTTLALFQLSG